MMRIYVPGTFSDLAELVERGTFCLSQQVMTATDESEESEYAALMQAADRSAELLGGQNQAGFNEQVNERTGKLADGLRRRVVIVAEVPIAPGLGEPVVMDQVVAAHVDTQDDADFDDDLAWFATQELDSLI
jgi:hypothetical protein